MTTLTRQQQLTILYNMYWNSEARGNTATYVLTTPIKNGSGFTVGINQIDFGQKPLEAALFVDAVNGYVGNNPQLNLTPLSPNDLGYLISKLGQSQINGQTVTAAMLAPYSTNTAITDFLGSASGQAWVDHNSGLIVGNDLQVVINNIGNTAAGATILNDPAMLSLLMEVKNNAGNVKAFANLLNPQNDGTWTFPDNQTVTLTAAQQAGNITFSDLQNILVHEYAAGSTQAQSIFGNYATSAESAAAAFNAGTLHQPSATFLNNAQTASIGDAGQVPSFNPIGTGASSIFVTGVASMSNSFWGTTFTVPKISPIILDLTGSGVQTISESAGVYFDLQNKGFAQQTGWVSPNDGLLVWDRNGNGTIDNGSELFGNYTSMANGATASNGFQALASYDTNGDGKIDASDAIWSNLKVWIDSNSNGVTDPGELYSLSSLGIQSLSLGYSDQGRNATDSSGNHPEFVGSYTLTNGTTRAMDDVFFASNPSSTVAESWVATTTSIAALPDVPGMGTMYSLHQAMARDATGTLQSLVTQFTTQTTISARNATLEQILILWGGAQNVNPSSRNSNGGNFNAQHLTVLESAMGTAFNQAGWTNPGDPTPDTAPELANDYFFLSERIYSQLAAQTFLASFYNQVTTATDSNGNTVFNFSAALNSLFATGTNDQITEFYRTVFGSGLLDAQVNYAGLLSALSANKPALVSQVNSMVAPYYVTNLGENLNLQSYLSPSDGGTIVGGLGGNVISMDTNANTLTNVANITVYGNAGTNTINARGDIGNSVYGVSHIYGGTGNDTINETGFLEAGTVIDGGAGNNTLNLAGGTSQLNINTDISNAAISNIQTVNISGAVKMTASQLASFATVTSPSSGQNEIDATTAGTYSLAGKNAANLLTLSALNTTGNITLIGDNQNGETLWGGSGVDVLIAGNGNNDVLNAGSGNTTLTAGSGNGDRLYGGSSNTGIYTLIAGIGNDTLTHGSGLNKYQFGTIFGQDVVSNYSANGIGNEADFISSATTYENLWFKQNGNDLVVTLIGTSDTITVQGWFVAGSNAQLASFNAGGLTLTNAEVTPLLNAMNAYQTANPGFNPSTATKMPTTAALQSAIALAWGRYDSVTVNSDGSWTGTLHDHVGGNWSYYTDYYNASSQLYQNNKFFNDGSAVDTSYDVTGGAWKDGIYTYNAAGVQTQVHWDNNDGSTFTSFYNGTTGALIVNQSINANGSGYIGTVNNQTINFVSGDVTSVSIGTAGDVLATVSSSTGAWSTDAFDLSSGGFSLVEGATSFSDSLAGTGISVDVNGNTTLTSNVSGYGETVTVAPSGTVNFAVSRDTLSFASGALTSVSYNSSSSIFTYNLVPTGTGFSESVTWNPNTGKAILNITPSGGSTFASSLGWINPGYVLSVSGSLLTMYNGSGQALNATQVNANGSQADISYDTTGGSWKDVIYYYSNTGVQTEIRYDNNDSSGSANFYDTLHGGVLLAQQTMNANGSGSVTANSVTLQYAVGDQAAISVGSNSDALVGITSNNGTETFDLASGVFTAHVGASSFTDSLSGTSAVVDASGNVTLTSNVSGYGETVTVAPSGVANFAVGRDTLSFAAGALTSVSYNNSSSTFTYNLAPTGSGFSESVTWNPNVGKAILNITPSGGSTFASSLGWINPGYVLSVSSSMLTMYNGSGQALNATQVNTDGSQADISYDTVGGSWKDTIYYYNSAGVQTEIRYDNNNGSFVDNFYNAAGTQTGSVVYNADGILHAQNGSITADSLTGITTLDVNGSASLTAAELSTLTTLTNSTGSAATLNATTAGTYSLAGKTTTGLFNLSAAATTASTTLIAGAGATTLTAGTGNSNLDGGTGYDSYAFGSSFGQDIINNAYGGLTAANGEVDFNGSSSQSLWFQQSGNNLLVDLLGTTDQITVSGWFGSNAGAKVQVLKSSDGLKLDTQVSQLVAAMATYAANHTGFSASSATAMPADSTLQTAITAAWHH